MKNYYNAVKQVLLDYPETRDDDMLLYARFCYKFGYASMDTCFINFMATAKKKGVPSYESVTRARRKVQETEPYLGGERRKQRKEEAENVRKYYAEHRS